MDHEKQMMDMWRHNDLRRYYNIVEHEWQIVDNPIVVYSSNVK